jgi:hypothetical protein|tara:strand:+ start:7641 stop:7790 length:150 start_codon:yes stop_codon:yes gene_type:complete
MLDRMIRRLEAQRACLAAAGEVLFSAGDALSEEQVTELISTITKTLAGD